MPAYDSGEVKCTPKILSLHNPGFAAANDDELFCFSGYISKFAPWVPLPRAKSWNWGVPQWTIHHVQGLGPRQKVAEGRGRPSKWYSIPELQAQGLAPADENYAFTLTFRNTHDNWYERGHLTQKYLAERLPDKAGWFTHNVLNAVPQRAKFNKGPWLTLECYTGAWANEYGEVWIISGPVFYKGTPSAWLESNVARERFRIAIPDAIFKVVIREGEDGGWDTLAFLYPQDHEDYRKLKAWSPSDRLVSIKRIEELTNQSFSSDLKPTGLSRSKEGRIWPVKKKSFDPSCRRFAVEVP